MTERDGPDREFDDILRPDPSRGEYLPNSRPSGSLSTEGCEVVHTYERPYRFVHGVHVEWLLYVPRRACREGIVHRSVRDQVPISSLNGREPGVESVANLGNGVRCDLRAELCIEASLKPFGIERLIDEEADNLTGCVHPGIGAPGHSRLHLAGDPEQCRLQVSLDGSHVVLTTVSVKVRAVVCEVDPVGRHR